MKRIIAIAIIVVVFAAMLCACGNTKTTNTAATSQGSTVSVENVTTTVNTKYDDGFAETYASSSTTDKDGNKVYEFTGIQYNNYEKAHKTSVADEIQKMYVNNHKKDKSFGEYVYINTEDNSIVVGLHKGEYKEKTASSEAKDAAEYGFKYFQNLKEPVDSIKVVYCNANNQSEIYGSFEFTADETNASEASTESK